MSEEVESPAYRLDVPLLLQQVGLELAACGAQDPLRDDIILMTSLWAGQPELTRVKPAQLNCVSVKRSASSYHLLRGVRAPSGLRLLHLLRLLWFSDGRRAGAAAVPEPKATIPSSSAARPIQSSRVNVSLLTTLALAQSLGSQRC